MADTTNGLAAEADTDNYVYPADLSHWARSLSRAQDYINAASVSHAAGGSAMEVIGEALSEARRMISQVEQCLSKCLGSDAERDERAKRLADALDIDIMPPWLSVRDDADEDAEGVLTDAECHAMAAQLNAAAADKIPMARRRRTRRERLMEGRDHA